MKRLISSLFILLSILTNYKSINAQFECGYVSHTPAYSFSTNPFQGYARPNRTDTINGIPLPSTAYFPILVVFVQFKNQGDAPRNSWPSNLPPVYLQNMISTQKRTTGDWWNYYNENSEIISDHWMEISRGKFHAVGPAGAFSVVLAFEKSYYDSMPGYLSERVINAEMLDSVKAQGLTNWEDYDQWTYNISTNSFSYDPDGVVDMIYKVIKSRNSGINVDGFPSLAGHVTNYFQEAIVDPINGIKVIYGASGITASFRAQLDQYIGTLGHEHGHLMFSNGHSTYSRVSYGFGLDCFYSPADMILNEYMTPRNATMNATNLLGDYSSRNTESGEILKVPVQGNEYFLLVSRNKVSKYDKVMTGDLAQITPYSEESDYGKGLYIYHVRNGINFPSGAVSQQDMECADGLFLFEYGGQSAQQVVHDCYRSGSTAWGYYNKKSVIYENDSSNLFRIPPSGYTFRNIGDGISFRHYLGVINEEHAYLVKWWGEGNQPTSDCDIGTDRICTNNEEAYTRFDFGGDRWDAWTPGYNEIFSPYSSPNTNTWTTNPSNQNSGIFIWHYTNSISGPTGYSYIKVYKAEETGSFDLDSILHLTPPSRPMGMRILECDSLPTVDGTKRMKMRWLHNMEPDMLTTIAGPVGYMKYYKIYRSVGPDLNTPPPDALAYSENEYDLIDSVFIDEYYSPSYIDYTQVSRCNTMEPGCPPACPYPVRYRVQAIDKYGDKSVLSDFDKAIVYGNGSEGEEGGDYISAENEDLPKQFSLKQNYPNPFNPVTNIQYDLPVDNFVSIKVYDVLGKEVISLTNDFKQAGSYIVSLNGNNLSSGIYYYKIKAGYFEQVRKMILIK